MGASTNHGPQEGSLCRVGITMENQIEKKMKVEMELGSYLGVWNRIFQLW